MHRKQVLLNPAHIAIVEPFVNKGNSDYSMVVLGNGNATNYLESVTKVGELIREAAFIPEGLTYGINEEPYLLLQDSKSIDDMTQAELDELSDEFIGEGDQFANLSTLFNAFVSERPKLYEVVRLIDKIESWGYHFKDAL